MRNPKLAHIVKNLLTIVKYSDHHPSTGHSLGPCIGYIVVGIFLKMFRIRDQLWTDLYLQCKAK